MSEGGPISLLFAATYPERVHSLVMYGVAPRFSQELPDWPWGFTRYAHQLTPLANAWTITTPSSTPRRPIARPFFGMSDGGPMSLLFTPTHHRTRSLTGRCTAWRHGYLRRCRIGPRGFDGKGRASEAIESHWGEGALAELFFGEIADIPGFHELYGRYQRVSASPTMAAWLWQASSRSTFAAFLVPFARPLLSWPDQMIESRHLRARRPWRLRFRGPDQDTARGAALARG